MRTNIQYKISTIQNGGFNMTSLETKIVLSFGKTLGQNQLGTSVHQKSYRNV